MVDAAGERKKSLQVIRDVALDLLRRHSGVKRGDDDDRNVHCREHIHGHLDNADPAEDGDDQADNDDEIGRVDGKSRHEVPYDFGAESPARLITLGLNFVAVLQPGARSDYDAVAFLQVAGSDFDPFCASRCQGGLERSGSFRTVGR